MYQAIRLSPMIPSYNVGETVLFFQDLLGFSTVINTGSYAVLQKNNYTVHILPAGDIGEMEFYLEVDDVNAVWASIKDKLDGIKHKAPFNREYGMREIHLVIPQTKTLLFIGQVIGN